MIHLLRTKINEQIAASSLSDIARSGTRSAIAIGLSAIVVYPAGSLEILGNLCALHDFAPIKIGVCFTLVHHYPQIASMIRKVKKAHGKRSTSRNIEGIPTVELLDHLFTEESFKRDDIETKFGIPRNRYTTLAQRLEDLNVLVRGPNNSRVLNTEFSRGDIAALLQGRQRTEELTPVLRPKTATSYTMGPTLSHMIERVKSALIPSPSFTVRRISE